ncbi:MAG: multifunctional CCA addition/repair protein [Gammaproteobacteria bacterium]|nr:multifunctional CCA addition/repair protein [Gammaproteobacteria bacterium]
MEIYLVGGAVRDKRLGLPAVERDWVVVGSTPEEMRRLGYQQVGKEFPVFLHPETKEEYALARTERKTGHGYTGFETCATADITLEQDLQRRDLTINAMAETPDGELIDPCNGAADLSDGVLRHVSPAFSEDPVRILRVARFAARFAHWGFRVDHGTNALMRHMVQDGEVDHLVPERVCAELVKALAERTPSRFFAVLYGCGALARLFPEVEPLYLVDTEQGHGGTSPLVTLDAVVTDSRDPAIRFAALVCDIDRLEQDAFNRDTLAALCERLRLPNSYRELAQLALVHRRQLLAADRLEPESVLGLLENTDALRRPERFAGLLQVCASDARAHDEDFNRETLAQALATAQAVDTGALQQQGISGKALGEAIRLARIKAIETSM